MSEEQFPKAIEPPEMVARLASDCGGTISECAVLPDGSGFAVMSMPLPKTHWLYQDDGSYEPPPMPMRMGTNDPNRGIRAEAIRAAARYAIRASTMNGKEIDFDPDAMVQNFVVGLLGYWTPDGLSSDLWANPPMVESAMPVAAVDPVGELAERDPSTRDQ